MATIGRKLAVELLENDGVYPGDPQCHSVWRYTHAEYGNRCYAVCYSEADAMRYFTSEFVKELTELWICGSGITFEGQEEIHSFELEDAHD